MKKIVLGLMLASVVQCNAADSKAQNLALAKEIAAVKEKLNEFKQQNFAGDVAKTAAIGAALGAIAAAVELVFFNRLYSDMSLAFANEKVQADFVNKMNVSVITMRTFFSALNGLCVGIINNTGSLPSLSQTEILYCLVAHNVVAARICSPRFIGRLPRGVNRREYFQSLGDATPDMIQEVAGYMPPDMLRDAVETAATVGANIASDKIIKDSFSAEALTLFDLLIAFYFIQAKRAKLGNEKDTLEASLKDLQRALDRISFNKEALAD